MRAIQRLSDDLDDGYITESTSTTSSLTEFDTRPSKFLEGSSFLRTSHMPCGSQFQVIMDDDETLTYPDVLMVRLNTFFPRFSADF